MERDIEIKKLNTGHIHIEYNKVEISISVSNDSELVLRSLNFDNLIIKPRASNTIILETSRN